MARRRKEQGGVLLVFIGLLVAAVAVVGPFVIAGWTIFAELGARRHQHGSRTGDLVTPSEAEELAKWDRRIEGLEAQARALELDGLARGLSKRADGLFDARNSEGRHLNQQLENLAADRSAAFSGLDGAKDRIGSRMEAWLKARSARAGARAALVTFVGVFLLMTISRLSEQGGSMSLPLVLFGSGADGGQRIIASAAATVAAGIAMWIGRSAARASLS